MNTTERGAEIYRSYGERLGLPPDECMDNLPGMLSASWDIDGFLAELGANDVAATIEARQHYGLDPFE